MDTLLVTYYIYCLTFKLLALYSWHTHSNHLLYRLQVFIPRAAGKPLNLSSDSAAFRPLQPRGSGTICPEIIAVHG